MRLFTAGLILALSFFLPGALLAEETPVTLESDGNKLFEQDPNPGGEEGSGCQICEYNFSTQTLRCAPVATGSSGFTKCKITVSPEEITCESSGSSCSALRVIP